MYAFQTGASSAGLFSYWAGLTGQEERFRVGEGLYQCGSRFMTLMEDYAAWKGRQTAAAPPAIGSAEEELARLKERFSGELSAFEVVDAVETMFARGLIDRTERNAIYGIRITVIRPNELPAFAENALPLTGGEDAFVTSPLMDFRSLADILDWLDRFRLQNLVQWERSVQLTRLEIVQWQVSMA